MPKYNKSNMMKGYGNDRYSVKGMGGKLMKNHGNTRPINTDQNQQMGKVQWRAMDYRGSPDQAFDYKY
jgi:hypothetical protein